MDRRQFLGCAGCAGAALLVGCAGSDVLRTSEHNISADETAVVPEALSYCGVDCNGCDVFKATVHGDAQALERAHTLWTKTAQKHWGMQTLDPALLRCKGCRSEGADIFKGCRHCPIRRCAKERKFLSCGRCPGWKHCERLVEIFDVEPQAKGNLEKIEAASHD